MKVPTAGQITSLHNAIVKAVDIFRKGTVTISLSGHDPLNLDTAKRRKEAYLETMRQKEILDTAIDDMMEGYMEVNNQLCLIEEENGIKNG